MTTGPGVIIATVVDIRTRRIPNALTATIAGFGIGFAAAGISHVSLLGALVGMALGLVLMLPGHALAFGVTSYDGKVFYGITADRDLVPDADVLGQCVTEALDELLDTASGARPKVPRGRRKGTRKS